MTCLDDSSETPQAAKPRRGRLLSSSLWIMGGTGAIQGFRLLSTLALSRLLDPSAFGLMALVTTFTSAIQLLSDVGLESSVNHDSRGDDPHFLNVAWTMQATRGVVIALLISALAYPLSTFYGEPTLRLMLPAVSIAALLGGLSSTSLWTLTRHLQPAKAVIWQVVAKFVSLVAMVALAWTWRSVWVLVIGALVEQLVRTVSSYAILPDRVHRFTRDRSVAKSLMKFGRWVWISTAATWLLGQGDKLILGKFLSAKELGLYSMATLLTGASIAAVESVASRVLMPYYASIVRDDPSKLRERTFRVRRALHLLVLPVLWGLILFGSTVVDLLYDERYADAGWMLRLVAVGAVATNVMRSSEQVILAHGDSFEYMLFKVAGGGLFLVGATVGGVLGGTTGIIVGTVAARYLVYIPLSVSLRKRDVWLPSLDLSAFAATGIIAALAYWLLP